MTNCSGTPNTSPANTTCTGTCGSTTVECARWDDDARLWHVALVGGETLTTRFLITATGFLSRPTSTLNAMREASRFPLTDYAIR